ncbi:MAG TPA: ATP-binding protein [Candidatus Cloacimonadota bacterium]|nr:ATP-binding protein [Candidatus Cloacimonadota bacterium]HPT72993.1 ATP-binding protein [Candidatus Cloacimonadota bacterium]
MPTQKGKSEKVIHEKQATTSGIDLAHQDELRHTILEGIVEGVLLAESVIITDNKGVIRYWNTPTEQMLGFTSDEMLGKNIRDLFHEKQWLKIYPINVSNSSHLHDYYGRIYELTAKGRLLDHIPLEIQITPIISGNEIYVALISRNITERKLQIEEMQKAKEEAEKANRLKSEFLSNMSHEIRTPMNAILGFAAITLNSLENEEQKEHLRIIQTSGENLLRLLNDILDLSKIEAERMVLQQKEFSIRRLMNEIREVFSLQAVQKKIKFIIDISNDTPDMYVGDEHRLRQILINFLSNAFKFTNAEGIVKVSFHHAKDTGYFEIRDTGIGIPKDKIHSIFNAFEQVDGSFTRQYGGTGLGLAITKRLVELMEGRIDVTSEENKGSLFKVQVKLHLSQGLESEMEEDIGADSKFKHILKKTENYRKGVAMVKKWIQFAEGDREIEDIICEAITLLPDKLEDIREAILGRDIKKTDFLTHSLKGETLNLHMNDVARIAKKMNDEARQTTTDWLSLEQDLLDLSDVLSIIPGDYLEKHLAKRSAQDIEKQHTILVAEDNAMNQKLMKAIIEKLGFACDVVENGLDALNKLGENEYLLLLLDMQMPVMDGLDLIKIIRNDYQLKDLYVVAVTAHAMKGDRERFIEAGCNEYLPKPIDFDKLSRVIDNTLKHKMNNNE